MTPAKISHLGYNMQPTISEGHNVTILAEIVKVPPAWRGLEREGKVVGAESWTSINLLKNLLVVSNVSVLVFCTQLTSRDLELGSMRDKYNSALKEVLL